MDWGRCQKLLTACNGPRVIVSHRQYIAHPILYHVETLNAQQSHHIIIYAVLYCAMGEIVCIMSNLQLPL